MSRTFLAVVTALALGATGCGGDPNERETTPARAERREPPRDEQRDQRDARDEADEPEEDDDVTVMDQGSSDGDVAITQQIRQAVMADDRLSFGAKNIAIITREGVVTLRGEVDTPEEHAVLQELANGVEGVRRLDDQVEVDTE